MFRNEWGIVAPPSSFSNLVAEIRIVLARIGRNRSNARGTLLFVPANKWTSTRRNVVRAIAAGPDW